MLDYCLCSNKFCDFVDDIYIVENEDDLSNHKPLVTVFKCNNNRKSSLKKNTVHYPCWDLNAPKIYYENNRNSSEYIKCFHCGVSGLCSDSNHRTLIDEYCDCFVDAFK